MKNPNFLGLKAALFFFQLSTAQVGGNAAFCASMDALPGSEFIRWKHDVHYLVPRFATHLKTEVSSCQSFISDTKAGPFDCHSEKFLGFEIRGVF